MNFSIEHSFPKEDQKIGLPCKNGLNFYSISKIIRCHSDNSYTEFFILDDERNCIRLLVSRGFDHFENFLVSKGEFYRVHNQHLVNTRHISKFVNTNRAYLLMDDRSDVMIPVARARKEQFKIFLETKGILV